MIRTTSFIKPTISTNDVRLSDDRVASGLRAATTVVDGYSAK
jgi:hypothetical protein